MSTSIQPDTRFKLSFAAARKDSKYLKPTKSSTLRFSNLTTKSDITQNLRETFEQFGEALIFFLPVIDETEGERTIEEAKGSVHIAFSRKEDAERAFENLRRTLQLEWASPIDHASTRRDDKAGAKMRMRYVCTICNDNVTYVKGAWNTHMREFHGEVARKQIVKKAERLTLVYPLIEQKTLVESKNALVESKELAIDLRDFIVANPTLMATTALKHFRLTRPPEERMIPTACNTAKKWCELHPELLEWDETDTTHPWIRPVFASCKSVSSAEPASVEDATVTRDETQSSDNTFGKAAADSMIPIPLTKSAAKSVSAEEEGIDSDDNSGDIDGSIDGDDR